MSITARIVIRVIPTGKGISPLFFIVGVFLAVIPLFGRENPHNATIGPCADCHIEQDWNMIHFNHDTTGYPLIGRHKEQACAACHDIVDFKKVGADCRDCHLDVHQGRLTPQCATCHTPGSWAVLSAVQAHRSTFFQLLGAHASLDCYQCHRNGRDNGFLITQTLCADCHIETYNATGAPNHRAAGFGLQCEQCHNLIRWTPALFPGHDDLFPIFSGTHSGEWNTCATCHESSGNYAAFTCFNCHEHNRAATDSKHDEVSGYVYASSACYACHPTGSGEND